MAKSLVFDLRSRNDKHASKNFGSVVKLVYTYALEAYPARGGGSSPLRPTNLQHAARHVGSSPFDIIHASLKV